MCYNNAKFYYSPHSKQVYVDKKLNCLYPDYLKSWFRQYHENAIKKSNGTFIPFFKMVYKHCSYESMNTVDTRADRLHYIPTQQHFMVGGEQI